MAIISGFNDRFGLVPGFSGDTLGNTAYIVATTVSAKIIEEHVLLDCSIGCPDAFVSMNKEVFSTMFKAVSETQRGVGRNSSEVTEKKKDGINSKVQNCESGLDIKKTLGVTSVYCEDR